MTIKTKRVYDPPEPEDGYRLLVTRSWPRGLAKTKVSGWERGLSPSQLILEAWRNALMAWETFEQMYRAEVVRTPFFLKAAKFKEQTHGTLTLLCFEDLDQPGAHCHRTILKDILDQMA